MGPAPRSARALDITELLHAWRGGDHAAFERLVEAIYAELDLIARRCMAGERVGHSLQPTALVNEAYLRLIDAQGVQWQNRQHFLSVAARQMRRVVVDVARAKGFQKRGGDAMHVTFDQDLPAVREPGRDLHASGIVHRDLKPANVFLTRHGVRLLDFGVARPANDDLAEAQLSLTQPGTLVGTPKYMAPEQVQGGPVDAPTDVFAAGAILTALRIAVTGRQNRYVHFASKTAVTASAIATLRSAKRRACASRLLPSTTVSARATRLSENGACSVIQAAVWSSCAARNALTAPPSRASR
jgi:hypothetical protein